MVTGRNGSGRAKKDSERRLWASEDINRLPLAREDRKRRLFERKDSERGLWASEERNRWP